VRHPSRLGQLRCILGTSALSPGLRSAIAYSTILGARGIGAPPGFAPGPVLFGDGLAEAVKQNAVLWVGKNAVPKLVLL
jgi:hypothetical protein